jgi:cation transport ATPase
MSPILVIAVTLALPVIVLPVAVRLVWPPPRSEAAARVAMALLVPVGLLVAYLVHEYGDRPWKLFARDSIVPHAAVTLMFLIALGEFLFRSDAPRFAKVVVGVASVLSWVALWFTVTLYTVCMLGDCL